MKISDILPSPEINVDFNEFVTQIKRFRSSGFETVEKREFNRYYVIGDIHGDLVTFRKILDKIGDIGKDEAIISLGDYGDRGKYQVETWLGILRLKWVLGKNFIPLRGNHEPDLNSMPYPHDIIYKLKEAFGEERGEEAYKELFDTFQVLPLAYVGKDFIALHGGFPIHAFDIYNEEEVRRSMYEILWNDPFEGYGFVPSPRGLGFLFGKDITLKWLSINKKKFLIRGHEPADGYKLNHDGLVITVFSRLGEPYFNTKAAFAVIEGDKVDFEVINR